MCSFTGSASNRGEKIAMSHKLLRQKSQNQVVDVLQMQKDAAEGKVFYVLPIFGMKLTIFGMKLTTSTILAHHAAALVFQFFALSPS
jgi:hypothetical protein